MQVQLSTPRSSAETAPADQGEGLQQEPLQVQNAAAWSAAELHQQIRAVGAGVSGVSAGTHSRHQA
jgi:hypothetical protein